MATVVPYRIADLQKLHDAHDAKILSGVFEQMRADVAALAAKLDAESGLTTKTYTSGLKTKP